MSPHDDRTGDSVASRYPCLVPDPLRDKTRCHRRRPEDRSTGVPAHPAPRQYVAPNHRNQPAHSRARVAHVDHLLHHHRRHLHRLPLHTHRVAVCACPPQHHDLHHSRATTGSHHSFSTPRNTAQTSDCDRTKSCRATVSANQNPSTRETRDTSHSRPTPAKQRPPARQ